MPKSEIRLPKNQFMEAFFQGCLTRSIYFPNPGMVPPKKILCHQYGSQENTKSTPEIEFEAYWDQKTQPSAYRMEKWPESNLWSRFTPQRDEGASHASAYFTIKDQLSFILLKTTQRYNPLLRHYLLKRK